VRVGVARHRTRYGVGFFGWAGLVLTVIASGVVLPGSNPVTVPDAVTSAAPDIVVTSVGGGVRTSSPAPTGGSPEPAVPTRLTPTSVPASWAPGVPTTATTTATSEPTTRQPAQIPPAPVTHLQVPVIGVDAAVVPVDSRPTGKKNAWGGDIYGTIEFPVDDNVRQWVRRGDPNSLPAAESTASRAFDRVVLYGHASDIGNHLVFQDLSALQPGDSIVATTDLGVFRYRVTLVASNAKYDLNNFAPLYDYPADGSKEIALVACLPDTTSNVVVIGTLVSARSA
jgi:hypothetical protein